MDALFLVERQDHLAIGAGLEFIFTLQLLTDLLVVVDLAVDTENLLAIRTDQRLATGSGIDNRETLVRQDRAFSLVESAPIRSAMADPFAHFQRLFSQVMYITLYIKYSCYATHKEF